MIVLYDENTTSFDSLGIGVLTEFKTTPTITEVLKGEYILEFEYPKNVKYTEYLTARNIIKALGQAFRIDNVQPSKDGYKVLARHIVFDFRDNYLIDTAPTKKTAHEALNWILEHAYFKTNFYATGDCTKIESARYVRKKLSIAFWDEDNSILNKFGGEPEYDNYHIIMHNFRGKETGIEIREKKNLTGFNMNIDLSTVKTKIMPVGKDGLLLPELFVDSPLINNYSNPKIDNLELNIGVDEETTEEQAYQLMRDAVNHKFDEGLDKPTVSLQVDFVELSKTEEYKDYQNLESISLGDILRFYMPSLNQKTTIRVIKTVKNALNGRIISLELGNEIPNIVTSQKQNNEVIKTQIMASALEEARTTATNLIKHPFNGHTFISEDTGEFYIADTTDINTAKYVWKWGLGGLGFSSTGVNGTYTTAWTQDGSFVADFITSGKLNTSVIEGYDKLLLEVSKMTDQSEKISQLEIMLNEITSEISHKYDFLESDEGTNQLDFDNSLEYQPVSFNIQGYTESFLYLFPMEAKLRELHIEGKSEQEGTPTPDAPIEIKTIGNGSEVKVKVTGKNILKPDFEAGDMNLETGLNEVNNGRIRTKGYVKVKPSKSYIFNQTANRLIQYDKNYNFISVIYGAIQFNTTANTKYIRVSFPNTSTDIQLEEGSTVTEYEAYKEKEVLIDLQDNELSSIGDTKDELSIIDGQVVIDKKIGKVVLDGSEDWKLNTSNNAFYITGDGYLTYENGGECISTHFPYNYGLKDSIYIGNSNFIIIRDTRFTTLADFKTWLSENNTTVYYELATPQQITLPNTNIELFDGINHITLVDDIETTITTVYNNNSNIETSKSGTNIVTITDCIERNLYPSDDLYPMGLVEGSCE